MKKLTHEQIIKRAYRGVMEQGAIARKGGGCRYRIFKADRVLACGVGHLISEENYSPRMEGYAAGPLFSDATSDRSREFHYAMALCSSGVDASDEKTARLLASIQGAHDLSSDLIDFKREMRLIAKDYGVKLPA